MIHEVGLTRNQTSQSRSQCRSWEDITLVYKIVQLTMNGIRITEGFIDSSVILKDSSVSETGDSSREKGGTQKFPIIHKKYSR